MFSAVGMRRFELFRRENANGQPSGSSLEAVNPSAFVSSLASALCKIISYHLSACKVAFETEAGQ